MKGGQAARVGRAVGWTLAVVAGLYAVDRTLIGSRPSTGWTEADSLDEVPEAAGRIAVPAYLPDSVSWPPARILFRTAEEPGWWLGLSAAKEDRIALWIGSASGPAPPALAEAAACAEATASAPCPPSWVVLTAEFANNRTVFVITTLGGKDAARIIERLD